MVWVALALYLLGVPMMAEHIRELYLIEDVKEAIHYGDAITLSGWELILDVDREGDGISQVGLGLIWPVMALLFVLDRLWVWGKGWWRDRRREEAPTRLEVLR